MNGYANWVADMIAADKVDYCSLSEEEQINFCLAYMNAIGGKIQKIQGIYLTNPAAPAAMRQAVLAAI